MRRARHVGGHLARVGAQPQLGDVDTLRAHVAGVAGGAQGDPGGQLDAERRRAAVAVRALDLQDAAGKLVVGARRGTGAAVGRRLAQHQPWAGHDLDAARVGLEDERSHGVRDDARLGARVVRPERSEVPAQAVEEPHRRHEREPGAGDDREHSRRRHVGASLRRPATPSEGGSSRSRVRTTPGWRPRPPGHPQPGSRSRICRPGGPGRWPAPARRPAAGCRAGGWSSGSCAAAARRGSA